MQIDLWEQSYNHEKGVTNTEISLFIESLRYLRLKNKTEYHLPITQISKLLCPPQENRGFSHRRNRTRGL